MTAQSTKLQITIGMESATLIDGLAMFLRKTTQALSDGFQPGDDLPEIAKSAFADLAPILMSIAKVKDEVAAFPDSRAIMAALLINELMDLL